MTRERQIPEEAVEAVAFRFATETFPDYRYVGGWQRFQDERPADTKLYLGRAERVVQAARAALRSEWEKELLSDEAVEAAATVFWGVPPDGWGGRGRRDFRTALEAAISTTRGEGER